MAVRWALSFGGSIVSDKNREIRAKFSSWLQGRQYLATYSKLSKLYWSVLVVLSYVVLEPGRQLFASAELMLKNNDFWKILYLKRCRNNYTLIARCVLLVCRLGFTQVLKTVQIDLLDMLVWRVKWFRIIYRVDLVKSINSIDFIVQFSVFSAFMIHLW